MEAIYFIILWWFLLYVDMNQPRVYVCPPSWTPAHAPPHPIPLGCPRALSLSTLLHASNLYWSSILHIVIYMFQCYSLILSHPHFLPQSPKVCSLYLCLFCCHRYHLSKFHIYVLICCIGVSLSDLTSLCIIGSSFIHFIRTDSNAFFPPLCICPTTSLSICLPMASRLLPCPSYCKQCCSEHWGTCVSFNFDFLGVCAQQWDFWAVLSPVF